MTANSRIAEALRAAVIVLAGLWIYFPALRGDWVWDDITEVAQNPVLEDPAGLRSIWTAAKGADYFPLKTTLQWLEWRAWGPHPLGYHLATLALHLLSALLFWRLLARWGVRWAWVGGLLLVLHPLAVESVAWIAETKNTLSLALALLALHAYVSFDERASAVKTARRSPNGEGRAFYWLSLLCFLAALLSKTTVAMFPVILLLYAWWRRGRVGGSDLGASVPFFALSLGLGLVTVWFQEHRAMAGADVGAGGLGSRIAGSGLAVAFYIGKFVWPSALMPNYPRWSMASPRPWEFLPWLGLIALAALCWSRRAGWGRHVLFGIGAFVISIAPVLGLVPMAYLRISWVADHFAYFPMPALAGLAAAGAGSLAARRPLRAPVIAAAAAAGLVLAGVSRSYARIFRDDDAFWSYAVAENPASWLAHNDLGLVRAQAGRWPEAIAHYEEAIRLNPGFAEAHNNLGAALAVSGRLPLAIGQFVEALRLQPHYLQARIDLANALAQSGRFPEAIEQYGQVLRREPGSAELHGHLGFALSESGRPSEAVAQYEEALRLDPNFAEAHYRLGNALGNAGRLAEAIPHYERAVRLNPAFAEARANLGLALARGGRPTDGIAELREALRLRPDYAEAHAYLGLVLAQTGQFSEAVREDQAALRLDPGNADVRYNLASASRALGR